MATEREREYIRARSRLLTTEQGGRNTPICSGYRSHWAFPSEVHEEHHDPSLTLEATQTLWLDEEAIVRLHPLVPDLWPLVRPGMRLTMLEDARLSASPMLRR